MTVTAIGEQVLQAVGLNPIPNSAQTVTPTVTHSNAQIAELALQRCGVNLTGQTQATEGTVFNLTDMGNKALIFLNVYANDETPAANDTAQALAWATAFHDDLVQRGFINWGTTSIPAGVANLYAIAIASQLAPAYEKTADPNAYAGAVGAIKSMALANLNAQAYALDQMQTLHQVLVGKDLANWQMVSIPDPVVPYYVTLVAQMMGPTFGVPFDPAAYNGGMSGIRRFVYSGAKGQALAEAKVSQVHERLNALNLTGWLSSAIPVAAAEAYVQMAAFLLEPILERQPDMPQLYTQEAFDAGVARVREIVLSGSYAVTIATQELTQIHDALAGSSTITWDIDHIPSSVADSYTTMLALNLAPIFAKGANDPKMAQLMRDQVEEFSIILGSQPLAEQVLRGLHAEWRSRGMTRWEIVNIPREMEDSYVNVTALRLAPQFPQRLYAAGAVNPQWETAAEMKLWQVVTVGSDYRPVQAEYF